MTDDDILASLAPKRRKFIVEYCLDENGAAACVRAGYSPKVANREASRLLANADIRQLIDARLARQRAAVAERVEVKLERLLLETLRIATVDPATAFDAQGNLLPITDMPEDTRRAIAGFEVILKNAKAGDGLIDTVHKVRWWPKTPALELAAKLAGLYVEKREVGKPGQFRTLTDAQLREKALQAVKVLGLRVVEPEQVM